jgi:excisionase family DNA binding protein
MTETDPAATWGTATRVTTRKAAGVATMKRRATATTMTTTATTDSGIETGVLQRLQAQLDRLELKLDEALAGQRRKDWYTTEEVAERRGVSADTVREWCRYKRIRAEKRQTGQGPARPWMIAHAELERLLNEGLLPLRIVGD